MVFPCYPIPFKVAKCSMSRTTIFIIFALNEKT